MALNTRTNENSNTADILITIETSGADMLDNIVDKISQVPNIINVERSQKGNSH